MKKKKVLGSSYLKSTSVKPPAASPPSYNKAASGRRSDNRTQDFEAKWKEQKQSLTNIDQTIGKLVDRLIETTSTLTIRVYERKLEKLEAEKALIAENLAQKHDLSQDFDKRFRTDLAFLANPWNLWDSPKPAHRNTLIKLVFAAPLQYARNQGFRTAKTTRPCKVLGAISDDKK